MWHCCFVALHVRSIYEIYQHDVPFHGKSINKWELGLPLPWRRTSSCIGLLPWRRTSPYMRFTSIFVAFYSSTRVLPGPTPKFAQNGRQAARITHDGRDEDNDQHQGTLRDAIGPSKVEKKHGNLWEKYGNYTIFEWKLLASCNHKHQSDESLV